MSVVLPAPFGPISACRAPGASVSATSVFALNSPNCFDSPSVCSAARHVFFAVRAIAKARQRTEDAAAREEHDDDQQQPQPELPVDGVEVRQVMVGDHEHGRADERSVQPPGAAQHHHDHEVGGAGKAEHVEADELRRLREQPAGHARHRRADRVDRDQPARHGEPIAGIRFTFSRMPRSDRPNGELTMRRAMTNRMNRTARL